MATLSRTASKFTNSNKNQLDVSILERKAREFLCRQQEAKDWIEEMIKDKLPPGTANFTDSLRDGVYLCLLAQSFMPGSVTKIHKPKIGSVLEFMATDNYNQFFRSCEKVQFPKIYMFEVTDLWEKKNIINVYKVVHCLHTLAHFLAQRGKGVRIKNLSKANLEFDEEEIRKTKEELQKLEDTAEIVFVMPDDEEQKLIPSVPDPVDVESEEEPSQDLADPDKTVATGDGAKFARAGEEATFTIQAKDSSDENLTTGGEVFTVILFHKTDSSVTVVANVKDNGNGSYTVTYTPEKQGDYSMEIHLIDEADKKGDDVDEDGEQAGDEEDNKLLLKGCPMIVNVTAAKTSDPSKCEITGLGSETAVAGVQTSFTVQGFDKFGNKTAETEDLKAVLVGTNTKSATQVEANVNYEGNGLYTVSYTCPMSGEYRLDVALAGTQLQSKKVIVKDAGISDPTSSVVEIPAEVLSKPLKAGEPIVFTIQAKDKHGNDRNSGGETFTVKIVDSTGAEVPLSTSEINDTNDGKYAVKVATEKSGDFKLRVVLNDNDLNGSPVPVQIADAGLTDPSTSVLTSDQDYKLVKAGESRTLSIEARDKFGNKRKLNDNEQFILVAVSKEKKDQLITPPATLNEQTGKYDITFTLEDADEHALQVVLVTKEESGDKSENIQGFPCDIKVTECGKTDPSKTVFEGEGLKRAVANQPAKFTIHAHDLFNNARRAGGDEVQVTLINPKRNLTFTAEVTDIEDGTYEVNYLPTTSGQYQVVVTINGQQVVTQQLPKDTLSLIVEAPPAKEISETELDTIHDHDLLNSLVNSFHVEQDNENLIEEINTVREELIKQIKTNSSVEIGLKDVERKIQNLVNNRLQLEELISQRGGGLFGRRVKPATAKPEQNSLLSNQKKMENYGKLFYLLQTDPAYLSKCLYLVPPEKVDKFLETVILTLYGYAFSAREEYLILNLFKMTLQLEVSKSRRLGSFLNNNPVLPKMVMTYGRRVQGQQFLQKVLFDKILQKILNDKDLNLELNAVKLLKEHISKEEVRTGVKSTVNLRDLTFQKAMEDETVSKLVNERIAQLTQICQMILDGIIENVSEIPYGLRWVCKQLDQLLQEKHRDSTEAERASVVGYIAYYRFMNPAIVSPDFFGLTKKNQKISMNMRNNLVIVSKVLTNLANGVLFDAKIEPQMTLMNDWIKKNQKVYVEQFTRGLTSVGDPEEALGVHQFLELTQKKAPAITITWNELFSTHSLLLKYLPKLVTGAANDPLKQIVDELGEAPAELPDEKNEEITLALVSNVVKVDKVQEVTPEQLYETTKDAFRFVLKSLPADNLGENVLDTLEKAKKHANDKLKQPVKVQEGGDGESQQQIIEKANATLAKIKQIEEALPKLEDAQILAKANQYRKLLVDITKEIQNQKIIRQKQRKDLERLKESLKSLQTHHKYLEERVQQYQAYVKDIHTSMFNKESQTAKKRRISKKKVKDKHKFTYKQLKEKGVIVDLNVMSSQKKNIGFCISMPNPGVFDVEAQLAGMTVKTISLTLDELLDRQARSTAQIALDNVVLDVNMTLHLVNKLFANV